MKTSDNKAIIRRFVEESENTGDVTNIDEFISEDYAEVHNGEIFQIGIRDATEHDGASNLLDPLCQAGVVVKV